jgi:hypothetical protein
MNTTYKNFWLRASDAYNCFGNDVEKMLLESSDDDDDSISSGQKSTAADEFTKLVCPPDDPYLVALLDNDDINLHKVDPFTPEAFRKKIHTLLKIRGIMKKNMVQSGTHDNDPWNFVEIAMRDFTGLTPIGVYYFYTRCEANEGVDSVFQPFLDSSLKGSSVDLGEDQSATSGSSRKRKKEESFEVLVGMHQKMMDQMNANHGTLMDSLEEQMKETKRSTDVKQEECNEIKRHNNFMQRLELAKAMNDNEALQKLKEEANGS